MLQKQGMEQINSPEGKISNGDFLISIKYTQHHTWQGTVTWISEKKEVPFRSTLELLKLIDSAMDGNVPDWNVATE